MRHKIPLFIFSLIFCGCIDVPEDGVIGVFMCPEENIVFDNKVTCQFEIGNQRFSGRVKKRGGWSSRFEKSNFTINFDKEILINGLKKDDDFILNACYIDKTFLRNLLSYTIFSSFSNKNIAPKTKYTEIYINDQYNGLYLLTERLDFSSLSLDEGGALFKEPCVFRTSISSEMSESVYYYHQKYPDISQGFRYGLLDSLRSFVLNSSDSLFIKNVNKYIDIESVIDWHILILLTNNSDGIVKNFYLYKPDYLSALRISPWDYDHSFGRDGDNELNMLSRIVDPNRNILLCRLNNNSQYLLRLNERWARLRNNHKINRETFSDLIEYNSNLIREGVEKNSQLWPSNSANYFDDNTFEEEINLLHEYFNMILPKLDSLFCYSP